MGEREYEQRKAEFSEKVVRRSFQKMSKSKGTGLNPLDVVETSSVDILRLALTFAAPPESSL